MLDELKKAANSKANGGDVVFWFVRHAESEGNILDDSCPAMHDMPLTRRGIKAAERIAEYFRSNNIKVTDVYSAPRQRSKKTAQIIAEKNGLAVKLKAGLDERDWGVWKDLRWMEVSERLDKLSIEERYSFVPEGGESWRDMEARLFRALIEIAKENDALENVVIVMHRGGLRAILPKLVSRGIEFHAEFSVKTGSISKFVFSRNALEFIGLIP